MTKPSKIVFIKFDEKISYELKNRKDKMINKDNKANEAIFIELVLTNLARTN